MRTRREMEVRGRRRERRGSTGEQVGEVNSSGCLTSSRVQFSMYTLPCTMSCPSMRKFRRMSCGPFSGTLIKTRAGLGFDAFVVTRRPRRLEGGGGRPSESA